MATKKAAAKKAAAKTATKTAGKDKEVRAVGGAGKGIEGAADRVADANAKMVWGDGDLAAEGSASATGTEQPKTAKAAAVPANSALQPRPEKPPVYTAEANSEVAAAEAAAKSKK